MSPSQFEQYVARVVAQLHFTKSGTVVCNAKIPGVRQAGIYEIDIAVHVRLDNVINFFLIVECKNWSRPVDRPVIQKLAQTRDAVAAQKAAVASPLGFTKEAIAVAHDLGIALWVMSKADWTIIKGFKGPSIAAQLRYNKRVDFLKQVDFISADNQMRTNLNRRAFSDAGTLVAFSHTLPSLDANDSVVNYIHACTDGSMVNPGTNELGIDPRLVATELASDYGRLRGLSVPAACGGELLQF
jgi:hypothetical protein